MHTKVAWIQDFIMLPDSEQSAGRVETWVGMGLGNDGQTVQATGRDGGMGEGGREVETPIS